MNLFRLTTNIEELDEFDIVSMAIESIYGIMQMIYIFYFNKYPNLRMVVQSFQGTDREVIDSMHNMAKLTEHFLELKNKMMGYQS